MNIKKDSIITLGKEEYKVVSILGEGAFGKVYKILKGDNMVYALKIFSRKEAYLMEKSIFQSISHIIKKPILYGYGSLYNYNYIIITFISGSSVDKVIECEYRTRFRFSLSNMKSMVASCVKPLAKLHANGLCHRDIKLENVLFHNNILILIDYGSLCSVKTKKGLRLCKEINVGSPFYKSPELIKNKSMDDPQAYFASDIWALGLVLYQLAIGENIMWELMTFVEDIKDGTYKEKYFPIKKIKYKEVEEIIKGCLTVDYHKRIKATKILELINAKEVDKEGKRLYNPA